MSDRIEIAFRREAERLVGRGGRVLAAVSGGGDSVALLHLLQRVARGLSLTVGVAHLDHGLRAGSAGDRRFVETLARDAGLPCHSDRRPVRALRRRDESPEEAARRVRRGFLCEVAAAAGYERVAVGHNLDDQAETILMRLARGAGATALTGMAASGPGPFVRPLLGIERAELRRYLERRDRPWREDPSNADLSFDRNRLRRRVMPVIEAALNPRAARHLVRAARLAREDALHLDGLAGAELDQARHDRRGRLVLDAGRIARLAPPIARRLCRLALERAGCDLRRLSARHIDALLELASAGGRRRLDLPSGVLALSDRGSVRIGR